MRKRLNYSKNRVWFIDEIRGIAIVLMVLYHAIFDMVFRFNVEIAAFSCGPVNLIRDFFAGLFIFISGVSCRFSSNNLKRGLKCLALGMGITVITYIFFKNQAIYFGILHMLGLSMILYGLFEKFIDKIKFPTLGIIISGLLFCLSKSIGALPFEIGDDLKKWLFAFGIVSKNFSSLDYFPLVPWGFIFLAGTFFGIFAATNRLPSFFYKRHSKPVAFIGQNTLIIYLLHQPVIYVLLYLFFNYL